MMMTVTPHECAMMSQQVYEKNGGVAPEGWCVLETYYPQNSWGIGMAIYERITKYEWSDECPRHVKEYESRTKPKGEHEGKRIIFVEVERVVAYRGTYNYWNRIVDIALACGQKPPGYNYYYQKCKERESVWLVDNHPSLNADYFLNEMQKLLDITMPPSETEPNGYVLQRKITRLTYTGHSLGAACAELSGCESQYFRPTSYKVKVITFESPGIVHILKKNNDNGESLEWGQSLNYYGAGVPSVTCYLSSPNLVNTMGKHVGVKIRVKLMPDKSFFTRLINFGTCIIDEVIRLYWGFFLLKHNLSLLNKPILKSTGVDIEKIFNDNFLDLQKKLNLNCLIESAPIAKILNAKALQIIAIISIYYILKKALTYYKYLKYHHSIDNIVAFSNKENEQPQFEMSNWPRWWQHIFMNEIKNLLFFVAPALPKKGLPYGNYGLLTICSHSQNTVLENRIQSTPGYKETTDANNYGTMWYKKPSTIIAATAITAVTTGAILKKTGMCNIL